jgi:hypothetical protein
VGAVMVLINLILNLVFVFPLGESGLALATSISAALNLAVLAVIARRRLSIDGLGEVLRSFVKSLILAAAMGVAVFGLCHLMTAANPERVLTSKLLWVFPPSCWEWSSTSAPPCSSVNRKPAASSPCGDRLTTGHPRTAPIPNGDAV